MSPTSNTAAPEATSQLAEPGETTRGAGRELPFDWAALVAHVIHPVRVAIIEALWWIGEPLSAKDFEKIFANRKLTTSYLSYHVVELAKAGALVKVEEQPVRGALKKSYFFPPSA
jgi:Helix-turn-helix domain